MIFNSPYWSNKTKIELLQRWILVHSYLYYELNTSVVDDHMYDANSKQLVNLQDSHRKAFKESIYYYAMKEFDGSTGFGYVQKLNQEHYDLVERDAHWINNRRLK